MVASDLVASELHPPGRAFVSQVFPFLPVAGCEGIAVACCGQRGEQSIPSLTVNRLPFPEASMVVLYPLEVHSRMFTSS